MKLHPIRWTCMTAVTLTSLSFGMTANAQAIKYSALGQTYGLLNGDNIALYISDRGDLGVPRRQGIIASKPSGNIDAITGSPLDILPDGSISTDPGTGVYGALFSRTSTSGLPLQQSIQAKSEYITGGGGIALENFALFGNNSNLHTLTGGYLHGDTVGTPTFSLSGNSATDILSATSAFTFSRAKMKMTQEVSFQYDPVRKNLVQFKITFQNTGTTDLTGIRYARAVNPNQGAFGTGTTTLATLQQLGTPTEPDAFAINSSASNRHLGLGVFSDQQNGKGTILLSTATTEENTLLDNPTAQLANSNYVKLLDGGAEYYEGNSLVNTTDDFRKADFQNSVKFESGGDDALLLLSPVINVAAGTSETFTFYYFFNNPAPSGVPEPGSVALLVSSLVGGCFLLRKHSRK